MKIPYLILIFLLIAKMSFAQQDSIVMSTDVGVGAMRNVKLWPLVEVLHSKDKKEVNAIFSLYGSSKTFSPGSKQFHIMPFCWYDSSRSYRDVKLLSFYYPSLFHFTRDEARDVRAFRFFEIAPHISLLEFSKAQDGWLMDNNVLFFMWQKVDSTQHKSSLVVFPIYWKYRNPQKSTLTILPFYRSSTYNQGSSSYFAATPFFWHFETILSVDELMYPHGNKRVSNTLFPIYWAHRDEDSNKHILFPFLWQYQNRKSQSFTLAPLFSVGHKTDSSSHLMITPFFWHRQNKAGYSNTLFPIWWNKKHRVGENTIYTNYVFPSLWTYSDRNRSHKLFFPLWFSFKNPTYQSATLFPLFSVGKSPDGKMRHFVLTPLVWDIKSPNHHATTILPILRTSRKYLPHDTISRTVLFPIIWTYKDKSKSRTTIFPIVWTHRDTSHRGTTVFPVFSVGSNAQHTRSHLMLTPLFWHVKKEDSYSNTFFPIFWTHKDSLTHGTSLLPLISAGSNAQHTKGHLMLTPLYWHTYNNGSYTNLLFPLIWNKKRVLGDDTIYINLVFPLFFDVKNKYYHSLTLLPLVSFGKNYATKNSYLAITPLFWHTVNGDMKRNVLFPLVWNSTEGTGIDQEKKTKVLPVYYFYKKAEIKRRVIFPLIWSFRDSSYRSFTFFPLVSRTWFKNNPDNLLALTPLFWHIRQGNNVKNVFFPLYWDIKKGSGETASHLRLLLPLYGSYKDKNIDNAILFPLVWHLNNPYYHSNTIVPLLSWGHSSSLTRKHLMVTPLFWRRTNQGDTTNLLLPIWWNTKQGKGGSAWKASTLFPLYWAYKDSSTNNKMLIPLIWKLKNENYQSFTFFPFFSKGQTPDTAFKHLVVTPLYWQFNYGEEVRKILFPIYSYHKKGTGADLRTWHTVFPLYYSYRDHDKNNKVLFPVIWSLKNPYYRSFTFMPFVSVGRSFDTTRTHFAITPFFWHTKNPYSTHNILFPIYWNSNKGSGENAQHRNVLFPIFWSYHDRTENNNVLFPLLWSYRSPSYKSFALLPFVAWGRSPISKRGYLAITPLYWHKASLAGSKDVLFPIFWHSSHKQGNGKATSTKILPLFYAYTDSSTSNRTIFPIVWWRKNSERTKLSLFPLFSYYKRADSTKTRVMVTPFFWHIEKPDYTQNIIFPLWWGKSYKVEQVCSRKMIFPIYFAVRDSNRNNKVLMPIYWSFKNKKYASITIPPLVSLGSSVDKSRQHLMLTPLFWHLKNKDNYTNVLFPLWWNKEHGEGKDKRITSVLFPLYFSHRDSLKHNQALLPLVFSFKNPFYQSFTILPILSSGHTPDRSMHHLVLTPLYWDVKYAESHVNMLFPFYSYYHDTTQLTKFNFLQFVYRYKKKQTRTETSILWPLIERQKDKDYSYLRISPLVWYNHDKEVEYLYIPFLYHHRIDQVADSKQALLWFYTSTHEYGVKRTSSAFWFLWWRDRYENDDYETRLAHYLYVNKSIKGSTESELFPFYHTTSDPNGNRFHSGFLGFNSSFKKQLNGSKEFYQEQKTLWFIRTKSNFKNLRDKGVIKDRRELRQLL